MMVAVNHQAAVSSRYGVLVDGDAQVLGVFCEHGYRIRDLPEREVAGSASSGRAAECVDAVAFLAGADRRGFPDAALGIVVVATGLALGLAPDQRRTPPPYLPTP